MPWAEIVAGIVAILGVIGGWWSLRRHGEERARRIEAERQRDESDHIIEALTGATPTQLEHARSARRRLAEQRDRNRRMRDS